MAGLVVFCLLSLALVLDKFLGEPAPGRHPVCWMGHMADRLEAFFRARALRAVDRKARMEGRADLEFAGRVLRRAGLWALCCLEACSVLPVLVLVWVACTLHPVCGLVAASVCLWLCLAPHSLADHAEAVRVPLEQGDLPKAQTKLSWIVGRQTKWLDRHGVARACVESVAENCADGVIATLFWGAAGYVLAGFPGAAALAFAQRAANTLDAMWGRKDAQYLHFGRYAALTDDVFNWPAARLAMPCVCLAANCVPGARPNRAWAMGLLFHNAHESPNSAWSEAAFAGALGLKLGGPAIYDRGLVDHPWLGTGTPDAGPCHIGWAIQLMFGTTWAAVGTLSLVVLAGQWLVQWLIG